MNPAIRICILICLIISFLTTAHAQTDSEYSPYYYKIPGITGIYKTTHGVTWPNSFDSDGTFIPYQYGHTTYMLLSLSGLAAKAALEGTNDELIDVVIGNYPWAYQIASEDLITRKGLSNLGTYAPWDLVDIFISKGIVQGYVVYHYETGSRGYFTGGAFDHSANVATVYAHQLNAIMIEESLIPTAQAHGLTELADCRGLTQEDTWTLYQSSIDKHALVVADPKVCWNRDYSVATGCFTIFPLDPSSPNQVTSFHRNTVLAAMNEPFAILGWPGGDEFNHTEAATINGGFNSATSYDHNLFVHGLLTPGLDDPIENYRMNEKGKVDLGQLTWETDVHYTAFIMSDGDFYGLNNTYIDDELGNVGEYFGHPDRGLFPMTWGSSADNLFQTRPSSVRTLGELATANDSFTLFGGGYYYPDLNPVLSQHMQNLKPLMEKMQLRTWLANFSDYDSTAARAAQDTVAATLTDLSGLFLIQYSPYTAGQGNTYWTTNSSGYAIPAISARYGIWNNSPFANEGDPLEVASYINSAPHTGPLTSEAFFDWTIVHIWSFFDDCQDMSQSGASFNPGAGIERCYASAKCCYENLAPHVRVVSAEELSWLAALHLRTSDTLDRYLDTATAELNDSTRSTADKDNLTAHMGFWRNWLSQQALSVESSKRAAFLKIQDTLKAVRDVNSTEPLAESFEEFSLSPLPQRGWIDSEGNSTITDSQSVSGTKSLNIDADSLVEKPVYLESSQEQWIEGKVKLGDWGVNDTSIPKGPGTAFVRFTDLGIIAFDGNGSGGGTWQTVGTGSYDPSQWIEVKIYLDYTNKSWDLYLDDQPVLTNLGFLTGTLDRTHGMRFRGEQYIDDIAVTNDSGASVPEWRLY